MCSAYFQLKYKFESNKVEYKCPKIEKFIFDHPLLKNINFDRGNMHISYYDNFKIVFYRAKTTESYYNLKNLESPVKKYMFNYEKNELIFTIDKLEIEDFYNKCIINIEDDINVLIKFNKRGNKLLKTIFNFHEKYNNIKIDY